MCALEYDPSMNKAALLTVALFVLACSTPREDGSSVPGVGDRAPALDLPLAAGGSFSLEVAVARGPVVLVFYRGLF